jgi:hypothetical protein
MKTLIAILVLAASLPAFADDPACGLAAKKIVDQEYKTNVDATYAGVDDSTPGQRNVYFSEGGCIFLVSFADKACTTVLSHEGVCM